MIELSSSGSVSGLRDSGCSPAQLRVTCEEVLPKSDKDRLILRFCVEEFDIKWDVSRSKNAYFIQRFRPFLNVSQCIGFGSM